MALKRTDNGQYIIKSKKELKAAMNLFQTLKAEIEQIREEHGLPEMEVDAVELKKAATAYMVQAGIEQVDIDGGAHATLVRQSYDSRFVATKADLEELDLSEFNTADRKVKPLRTIIFKKFPKGEAKEIWNRVTRRVVNKAAIEEVVAEGLLTVDEIAPSFIEKSKTPYLRVFEEKD